MTTSQAARRPLLVAYYRVSTARQGASGLGLEAQRAAVATHVAQSGADLAAEYTEVESGRKVHRLELRRALEDARARGATLVIAKLDRLARNVAFLSALMDDASVPFVALDLPGATRLHLHIMAAVAEQEAVAISQRTADALRAAKARGAVLGSPANLTDTSRARSLEVRRAHAAERDLKTAPLCRLMRDDGWTLQEIADYLTAHEHVLPRRPRPGQRPLPWQSVQVHRLLARARPVARLDRPRRKASRL